MGGVVKKITGKDSQPVQKLVEATKPEAPKATPAVTGDAKARQAALRAARRGSGRSLLSYSRTLGEQSALQGEDIK
jgi:hypothetical protein